MERNVGPSGDREAREMENDGCASSRKKKGCG